MNYEIIFSFLFILIIIKTLNSDNNFKSLNSNYGHLNQFNNLKNSKCYKPIDKCYSVKENFQNETCFNIKLPYSYFAVNYHNLSLSKWLPLRAVPDCWNYLKVMLCLIKYSPCLPETSHNTTLWYYQMLSYDLCRLTRNHCPHLIDSKTESNATFLIDKTPFFMNCDNFATNCINNLFHIDFPDRDNNVCIAPMVKTSSPSLWVDGFKGCSFHCKIDLNLTNNNAFNHLFGFVGLGFTLFNGFIILTLGIHKFLYKQYKCHPMIINFLFIHIYFLMGSLGWSIQLFDAFYDSIICKSDKSLRLRAPQSKIGESQTCVLVFSLVYCSLFAATLTSLSFFFIVNSVLSELTNNSNNNSLAIHDDKNNINDITPLNSKRNFQFSIGKKSRRKSNNNKDDFYGDGNNMKIIKFNHSKYSNQIRTSQLFVLLVSLALLVISLTLVDIKADPIAGICFLSSNSIVARLCLSLVPLTFILLIKSFVIIKICSRLHKIRKYLAFNNSSSQMNNLKNVSFLKFNNTISVNNINRTLLYFVFTIVFIWMICLFSFYAHFYLYITEQNWYNDLRSAFINRLRHILIFGTAVDKLRNLLDNLPQSITRPNINVYIVHNLSYFALNAIFIVFLLSGKAGFILWKVALNKLMTFTKESDNLSSHHLKHMVVPAILQVYAQDSHCLLNAAWNPGLFVYLIEKTKGSSSNQTNQCNEFVTGNNMNMSQPFQCYYDHNSGSIRSCVSMPVAPNNSYPMPPQSNPITNTNASINKFIEQSQQLTQHYAVRRSHSFGGKPGLSSHPRGVNSLNASCCAVAPVITHQHRHQHTQRNSSSGSSLASSGGVHSRKVFKTSTGSASMRSAATNYNRKVKHWRIKSRRTRANISNSWRLSLTNATRDLCPIAPQYQSLCMLHQPHPISQHSSHSHHPCLTPHHPHCQLKSHNSIIMRHSCNLSGAESYNSYQLMTAQSGARWRDLCRTRMTVEDAIGRANHLNLISVQHPVNATSFQNPHHKLPVLHVNELTKDRTKSLSSQSDKFDSEDEVVSIEESSNHVEIDKSLHHDSGPCLVESDADEIIKTVDITSSSNNSTSSIEQFCSDDSIVSVTSRNG